MTDAVAIRPDEEALLRDVAAREPNGHISMPCRMFLALMAELDRLRAADAPKPAASLL